MMVFSLFFVTNILWYGFETILDHPHFLRTISPLLFLPAPFFYLGVRNLIKGQQTWTKWDWIHLLPMFLHIVELIPIFSLSGDQKIIIAQEALGMNHGQLTSDRGLLATLPGDTLRFFLMIFYFGYSWILIYKEELFGRKDKNKNYFDSWIKTFLILFGVFQVVFLFQYFLNIQYFITGYFFPTLRIINVLVLLFLICAYTMMLMDKLHMSLEFFHLPNSKSNNHLQILLEEKNSSVRKRQFENGSQNLSKEIDPELDLLKIRMISLLEDQKIFLKPNLLVGEFAKEMGVSVRQLPFLFFSVYGRSFNDVLNKYRIESAKLKIEEGLLDSYTLESIGEDCGFNSRTTFYNVFVKEYSMSPSEYWSRFCDQRIEPDWANPPIFLARSSIQIWTCKKKVLNRFYLIDFQLWC